MNSRERFLAALQGEPVDRPPLAHIAALTTVELQESTGCRMPDVHHDPELLVSLLGANLDVLGFDAVTFIINYFNEPAALGADIEWGTPDRLPTFTSHPWREGTSRDIPGNLLELPPVSTYLEALKLAKERYGESVAVLGKIMGPLSMVQVMYGVENTLIGMIQEPDAVREMLQVAVEVLVACANAQFEAGVDAIGIGEGGAGANMLSPDMYGEFLMPVHQDLTDRIKGPAIMHICGDILPRLHMLGETGIACFNFDWAIAPKVMADAAEGKFSIMGNVSTTDLLNGEPQEIHRQVFENIEAGVQIISPGCAVSPKCPNNNLAAMADAVRMADLKQHGADT